MEIKSQVVVIGAGPAGLNAAKYAANSGCEVALIDAGVRLGGQYWRNTGDEKFDQSVHQDFDNAILLMEAVRANPRIKIYSGVSIWSASILNDEIVLRSADGAFITQRLILATGAFDRSIPFPGWDIPGVMTAGAAQSLLKGNRTLAGKNIVVGGTGPFLLPVATGLLEQGATSVQLIEASHALAWAPQLHILLQNPKKIFDALSYFSTLRRYGVSMKNRRAIVRATAGEDGSLKSVTVATINANFEILSTIEVPCDVAAISWGFTPDTALATSLGLPARIAIDGSATIKADDDQLALEIGGCKIFVAGELTGVGGSELALLEGAIAGLSVAGARASTRTLRKLRRRARRFAEVLYKVYQIPSGWKSWLTPETIICRCEEVPYEALNSARDQLGAVDARAMKLMTRCGMGMCQGRVCSRNVFDLLESTDRDRLRGSERPIITPITLGELAQEGLL